VNNLEELMTELACASVVLKRELYKRDDVASTTPEGVGGPTILVHTCMICERSAVGKGAQVRHQPNCALARLQRAQKALRAAWPKLFTSTPAQAAPSPSPSPSTTTAPALASASASVSGALSASTHPGGGVAPAKRAYDMHAWPESAPQSSRRKGRPKGVGKVGSDTRGPAVHPGTVQAAPPSE
jgi:hypothetical protein